MTPFFSLASVFTFLQGATERASSQLTVSSATPSLGPGVPGGSWAGRACSHHLGGALGSGGCGLDDCDGPLGVGAEWGQNYSEGPSAEG